MKSKIFLCLLLIVTMLAFVACADNGDGNDAEGMLNNGVDDIANGVDRVVDDIDGNNDYGTGLPGNGKSWNDSSIKNNGRNDSNVASKGALENDIL
ncbi:MAG: hypothetical protein HFG67_00275 [Firmicutes bacterium]|nr:hypothetical protein [Bacillota bacterium]